MSVRITPRRLVAVAAALALVVALVALPVLQRTFDFPLYSLIFCYFLFFWITQATSWNIFCGYAGYFSFGQGAFYGAGVYTTAILTARHEFSLIPALPIGGLVGGLIAFLTGVLVFRLRRLTGEIFALFTLAVALGLGSLANNWAAIDGGRGIPIGRVSYPDWLGSVTEMLYYLGLILVLATVLLAIVLQYSRLGFGLFAIRDDERVAEAIGVPALRYKLAIFTTGGAIAGISGALHAVQVNFVSPSTAFGIQLPLFVILMCVLGGRRHWLGPVLGAVLIYSVNDRLTGTGLAELSQILLAALLIAATLFLRGGIVPRLAQRPAPAAVAGGLALVIQYVATDQPVLTQLTIAMIVAMVALFVPDRVYRVLPGLRRNAKSEDHPARPAVAEEVPDRAPNP